MNIFPDNGLMKVKRRMHKLKVNEKLLLWKERRCNMVGGVLMIRRKILFWANAVLSGFTSDVKA